MAKVLTFMHTDYTLRRRIMRACQEYEKEMAARGEWMYKFQGRGGCFSDDEWENFLSGDYEL